MSKELTEQWRNGTLAKGLYYTRSSSGRKGFSFHTGSKRNMFSPYDRMAHQVEEVLAPVPDYNQFVELTEKVDQFSQLVKKVEALDEYKQKVHILNEANMELENTVGNLCEQLNDANKVIRFYANTDGLTEEEKQMSAEKYHLVYGLKANDYLEKWGVK